MTTDPKRVLPVEKDRSPAAPAGRVSNIRLSVGAAVNRDEALREGGPCGGTEPSSAS